MIDLTTDGLVELAINEPINSLLVTYIVNSTSMHIIFTQAENKGMDKVDHVYLITYDSNREFKNLQSVPEWTPQHEQCSKNLYN